MAAHRATQLKRLVDILMSRDHGTVGRLQSFSLNGGTADKVGPRRDTNTTFVSTGIDCGYFAQRTCIYVRSLIAHKTWPLRSLAIRQYRSLPICLNANVFMSLA